MRKPFYWAARKAWYVKGPDRKNIYLADDEGKAYEVWREMTTVQNANSVNAPVYAIAERFLRWAKANVAESTYGQ